MVIKVCFSAKGAIAKYYFASCALNAEIGLLLLPGFRKSFGINKH